MEHGASLCQELQGVLGLGMELQSIHILFLLLQAVAYLQQSSIKNGIVHAGANLESLLKVLFQSLWDRIRDGLAFRCQLCHFLNAGFRHFHQALDFRFRGFLELKADIFTPHFQRVEWFARQIILGCIHCRAAAK